jgi:2'-5' RNA ligase
MAAPLDWAAFSEADEESRQALLKRAAKLDPSIQVALQSTSKKGRKKTAETAELTEKKVAKSSGSKKSASKKSAAACVVKSEESENVQGSAAWVTKQLEAVGLSALAPRLALALPLELLPHVDQAQLDVLLRQSRTEPMPDTMDYIKLQCVIRAMHVKVAGTTGNASLPKNRSVSAVVPSQASASAASSSTKDVATLLQGEILTWSVEDALAWVSAIPALSRFVDLFRHCEMDGYRLLRLNDRKLLQRMKIESEADRALIMQHIADLKALQVTTAIVQHSDIVNKLIKGLAAELAHTNMQVASNPASGTLLSSKRVPNYFLSLRIGSLGLRSKVKKIQGEIEALIPELAGSRSILPPEQLHFTLGRLYLQTEDEIALAKRLLERCHVEVYQRLYPQNTEVAVNFRGVINYGGNTVFLETERGNERDLLIEFGNTVYDMFQAAGLTSKEFRFQPVAPILRVRQSKKPLTMKLQEVSETLLENYASAALGRNVFSSLDISAVADQTDADGYYCNLHSVLLQ